MRYFACWLFVFFLALIPLSSTFGAEQYINEVLDANPPHQILKEGPVMRVEKPRQAMELEPEVTIEEIVIPIELTPLLEAAPRIRKKIALTFDDGPDLRITPRILEILKEEGVVATFFVLGTNVERYPEVLKRIHNEGHLIANHSRTHMDFANLTNEEIIAFELDPTSRAVEKLTGYYPLVMRPPYGSLRTDSVTYLRQAGWRIVRWSLDTFDWDGARNRSEQIVARIAEQHHNNAIILMHCNGPTTVQALPEMIRILRDLGYDFVTVNQL